MTLPLFPDPATPNTTADPSVTPIRPPLATPVTDVSPAEVRATATPTVPLSIREVTGLIHDRLRPLMAWGPRIVHAQWIRPGVNAGARGFLSVTLADTKDSTVAIDGFIWERVDVQAILQQGQALGCDLSDRDGRCEVMLEVTIDFWAKKTKPYLRIHSLNMIGMKGLRQQQREATLKRLEQEGLLDRNKTLSWARPTLRIFCIGKRDSDGCHDAISILKRSGFRFQWTIHNVAVQGTAAVPTLAAAFTELATRRSDFDVVLLIRGGGSELDLLAYDEYVIAHAVALCGIPVVTGLGHTADHSVCDIVSFKALETPTAAASFLVDQVQCLHDQLSLTCDRLRGLALEHLHACEQRLLSQRPRFVRSALCLVHEHQRRRAARWHALYSSVKERVHRHRGLLQERHQPIPLDARRVLQAHRTMLAERFRSVLTEAPVRIANRRHQLHLWRQTLPLTALTTLVGPARVNMRHLRQRIHHISCETVRLAQRTLHRLHAHIQAASPDRYFGLGLSYVTRPDGSLIRRRADVTAGDPIRIHLIDGTVPATVNRKEEP